MKNNDYNLSEEQIAAVKKTADTLVRESFKKAGVNPEFAKSLILDTRTVEARRLLDILKSGVVFYTKAAKEHGQQLKDALKADGVEADLDGKDIDDVDPVIYSKKEYLKHIIQVNTYTFACEVLEQIGIRFSLRSEADKFYSKCLTELVKQWEDDQPHADN